MADNDRHTVTIELTKAQYAAAVIAAGGKDNLPAYLANLPIQYIRDKQGWADEYKVMLTNMHLMGVSLRRLTRCLLHEAEGNVGAVLDHFVRVNQAEPTEIENAQISAISTKCLQIEADANPDQYPKPDGGYIAATHRLYKRARDAK